MKKRTVGLEFLVRLNPLFIVPATTASHDEIVLRIWYMERRGEEVKVTCVREEPQNKIREMTFVFTVCKWKTCGSKELLGSLVTATSHSSTVPRTHCSILSSVWFSQVAVHIEGQFLSTLRHDNVAVGGDLLLSL